MEEQAAYKAEYFFPHVRDVNDEEMVLLFQTKSSSPLKCASNCAYEVWLSPTDDWRTGECVGLGGHRCTEGEAYIDEWHPTPTGDEVITLRLHWVNPRGGRVVFGHKTSVLYRAVFATSFLADVSDNASVSRWKCRWESSMKFGIKMSSQLARQNVVMASDEAEELSLYTMDLSSVWKLVPLPVRRLELKGLSIALATSSSEGEKRPQPRAQSRPRNQRLNPKTGKTAAVPPPSQSSTTYVATASSDKLPVPGQDVLTFAKACGWPVQTFDLGAIALYRFNVTLIGSARCAVLCYSEVPNYASAWATTNRKKVRMADAFLTSSSTIGLRGCRYLHLLHPRGQQVSVHAQRAQYPFDWKALDTPSEQMDGLVEACRANLIACVDGGLVDTCWRERVQWTGDMRMSAKALRVLTNNAEVTALVLHQLADSYDPRTGLVQGAWPSGLPSYRLEMPTYHLAFCLAAVEHDPTLRFDTRVAIAVRRSVDFWRENYLRDGLVGGMPGWNFTDWDMNDTSVTGRRQDKDGKHAVCNAWWVELCGRLGVESGVDLALFDSVFWTGRGYRLWSGESHQPNVHSTAAVLSSGFGNTRGLDFLRSTIAAGGLDGKVSAYFAFFVAAALARFDRAEARRFIAAYYGPIARTHGTIWEKHSAAASMAHGWSIGFVELL